MELLTASQSLLLVIDLQCKLMRQMYRPQMVLDATKRLVKLADLFDVPLLVTEQYPKGLGPTHPDVMKEFEAFSGHKKCVEKTSFGCCGDKDFVHVLDGLRHVKSTSRQIVVAGIEAHVCVLQTVIQLLDQGDQVFVCWDAVSGRGEEYRHHAIERMQQAGAVITNHESVGFEWCRDKNHDQFKQMSAMFKLGQPEI